MHGCLTSCYYALVGSPGMSDTTRSSQFACSTIADIVVAGAEFEVTYRRDGHLPNAHRDLDALREQMTASKVRFLAGLEGSTKKEDARLARELTRTQS